MCLFIKKNGVEGVQFKDGTFISLDDIEVENLTAGQRRELEDMHLYNELAIRKRLHDLGNFLQSLSNNIESNFNNIMDKLDKAEKTGLIAREYCPVNEPKVKLLAREGVIGSEELDEYFDKRIRDSVYVNNFLEVKWVEIFKKKIISTGNIAKAVTAILMLIGLMAGIIMAVR